MSAVTEHLQRAIDILEREGWIQGAMEGGAGGVCLLGALNIAPSWDVKFDLVRGEPVSFGYVRDVLEDRIGDRSIVSWNDQPGRTKSEVLDVLREAIERAESRG